jgi:hypothetical protein
MKLLPGIEGFVRKELLVLRAVRSGRPRRSRVDH